MGKEGILGGKNNSSKDTDIGSHEAISSIVDPFGWNVRLYIRKWVG